MREHPYKRPILEEIKENHGGKVFLTVNDIKELTGDSESTIRRNYPIKNGRILKVAFVDQLIHQYT